MPHVQGLPHSSVHGHVQHCVSAALAGRARVPSAPWLIPRYGSEIPLEIMADEKEQSNQREAVKAAAWLTAFKMELLLYVSLKSAFADSWEVL